MPMRPLSATRRDAWLTLVFCVLLGGFILAETSGYPIPQGRGFGRGPAFYPRVLAGALIALGALHFLRDFRRSRHSPAANPAESEKDAAPASAYGQVVVFFTLCAASILTMPHLGFLLSGFLLVFSSTLIIRGAFKVRDTAIAAVYAVGIMAIIYLIFSLFVGIQLPAATFLG
jgi:hypothetical protein